MSERGVALVTGASSGIGLATVGSLAADGWRVIATVRDPGRADALRSAVAGRDDIEIRRMDVTVPDAVSECVTGVLDDHGAVDLLVNNAGAGHRGTLEQLDDDELRGALELNFLGVARVTRAVIPGMRTRRSGRIVTVTSSNGVIGMPFSDAYNASKFAVEGLMEGLAPVLATFGVFVSVLEPGPDRPVRRAARQVQRHNGRAARRR
jgi:NAD(P)-dependent dehydrogenase (short-subunit alcohol dehydrogenase family)